jgi:matrixin
MTRVAVALTLAFLGTLLLNTRAAEGFVCTTTTGGACIHWAPGNATLHSLLGPSGGPLTNGTGSWDQNVINAGNEWNAVGAAFDFSYTVGGQFNDPCASTGVLQGCAGPPGDNPVFFASSVCGMGFGDIVGDTIDCFNSDSGQVFKSAVFMNSLTHWDAYDGPLNGTTNDIHRVLLHELGHVLGLGHPDHAGQHVDAIMNSQESDTDRLQDDDRAGIQTLYPHTDTPPTMGCQIDRPGHACGAWVLLAPVALALLGRRTRSPQSL